MISLYPFYFAQEYYSRLRKIIRCVQIILQIKEEKCRRKKANPGSEILNNDNNNDFHGFNNIHENDDAIHMDNDDNIIADNNDFQENDMDDMGGGGEDVFDLPNPHAETEDMNGYRGPDRRLYKPSSALNDTLAYEPEGEYEGLVQELMNKYITNTQNHMSSDDLAKRVSVWRSKITPVLALEEERKGFDIHSYGSKILSAFEKEGSFFGPKINGI